MEQEAKQDDVERLQNYLGKNLHQETVHTEFIRMAMMSVAHMTIFPVQDILGLDAITRLNTPGTTHANWEWRLPPQLLTSNVENSLHTLTKMYGRL